MIGARAKQIALDRSIGPWEAKAALMGAEVWPNPRADFDHRERHMPWVCSKDDEDPSQSQPTREEAAEEWVLDRVEMLRERGETLVSHDLKYKRNTATGEWDASYKTAQGGWLRFFGPGSEQQARQMCLAMDAFGTKRAADALRDARLGRTG